MAASSDAVLCQCIPPAQFALLDKGITGSDTGVPPELEQVVPLSRSLYQRLDELLMTLLPEETQFSVLALHIVQLSAPAVAAHGADQTRMVRQRFHAAPSLLEQVMVNVRRVLRVEDRLVLMVEAGAVVVFPGVDRHGIQRILERVHASVNLLQAGTLEPPLIRETSIVIGGGSFDRTRHALPTTHATPLLFSLYQQIGCTAHHLVLRPVLASRREESQHALHAADGPGHALSANAADGISQQEQPEQWAAIPFMDLPAALPAYLTHFIPCTLARELRCAPVGQERHCLTVALLDPQDQYVLRRLAQVTGYTIFPVQCQEDRLNALLTTGW